MFIQQMLLWISKKSVIGLLVLTWFFSLHSPVFAFEIGTHLGHFDRNAQKGALQTIRSIIGEPSGFPITMNIDIGWGASEIQELADAAKGFSIAVRVIGISSETSSSQLQSFVKELNKVTWGANGKPVVVLGNELNNLDVEWKNAQEYDVKSAGAAYKLLHNMVQKGSPSLDFAIYDLAAAPVDPYNFYKWQDFVAGAGSAYSGSMNTVFVANIYEDSAQVASQQISTIKSGITSPASKTILTEYGPKDPKSSLPKYIELYKSTPTIQGAEWATALLPNYCMTDKPVFGTFFWIKGKVYTIDGKEIDPATCTSSKPYEDESKNPDEEVKGIYVYKDIYKDTELKGEEGGRSRAARYVMACAPKFWIGAQVDGQDRTVYWEKLGEAEKTLSSYCLGDTGGNTNEPNCVFDPVTANFSVINDNLSVPLYRKATFNEKGQQMDNNRAESIESFFGTNTKTGRKTNDPLLYSPNSKVLSSQEYCAQTVKYLGAIDVLCKEPQANSSDGKKELGKGGECALNNTYINSEGIKKTYLQTLKEVQAAAASKNLDKAQNYCLLPIEEQNKQLMSDIGQVQPLTKNAFKVGYMVYYNTGRYKRDGGSLESQEDFDAFGKASQYFHPIYRTFQEYYGNVTFDVIPFLVPANVFSSALDEEVLVNPASKSQDYEPKQDASFDSPYFAVFRSLMPQSRIDQVPQDESKRKNAVESAMDFGLKNSWNILNDRGTDRPFIHCPICDVNYPTRGYKPQGLAADKNYLSFAKVIWQRINAGIYAKEFLMILNKQDQDSLVASAPDDWKNCNVVPEVVRGETASTLTSKGGVSFEENGKESFWGNVKKSITNIKSIVRAPQGQREDKYEYHMRGYLLLPQEYGLLFSTEQDILRRFLPYEKQVSILQGEEKRDDFAKFATLPRLSPTDATYDQEVPLYNRFLRLNGQVFSLEDQTLDSSGKHGKGKPPGTEKYYTESIDQYNERKNKAIGACLNRGIPPSSCPVPEREQIDITAKLNSWNPGYNEGKADYRPILPGGWIARTIFELMAHITATRGDRNYQDKYCGLEDYLLGTNCLAQGGQPTKSGGTLPGLGDIACMNVWVDEATAQQHAQDLAANIKTRVNWDAYYAGYLSNPVRQCSDSSKNPDPADYNDKAVQYLFESPPECGGVPCYEFISQQALSRKTSDGKVLDPYIAIAIALNENGGLKTARKDRLSQHFGVVTPIEGHSKECPDDNEYMGTIDEKSSIMINTLLSGYKGESTLGADGVAILERYKLGSNARPLEAQPYSLKMIQMTDLLSGGSYSPRCN